MRHSKEIVNQIKIIDEVLYSLNLPSHQSLYIRPFRSGTKGNDHRRGSRQTRECNGAIPLSKW